MKKIICLLVSIALVLSITTAFASEEFYVTFDYGDYTYSLDYDYPKETSTKMEIILNVVKYNGTDANPSPVKSIPATELMDIIYNGQVTNALSERLNIAAQEGRSMYVRKSLTLIENLVVDTPSQKDPNAITVIVNGKEVSFDQPPIIQNGRTLVPLRAIFEALNGTVDWDDTTKTVTSKRSDVIISLQIGSDQMIVNNEVKVLDVPAQIINSRTLVPVRAISEAFGCNVGWDGNTKTVTITE